MKAEWVRFPHLLTLNRSLPFMKTPKWDKRQQIKKKQHRSKNKRYAKKWSHFVSSLRSLPLLLLLFVSLFVFLSLHFCRVSFLYLFYSFFLCVCACHFCSKCKQIFTVMVKSALSFICYVCMHKMVQNGETYTPTSVAKPNDTHHQFHLMAVAYVMAFGRQHYQQQQQKQQDISTRLYANKGHAFISHRANTVCSFSLLSLCILLLYRCCAIAARFRYTHWTTCLSCLRLWMYMGNRETEKEREKRKWVMLTENTVLLSHFNA